MIGKLTYKALMNVDNVFTVNALPKLVTNVPLNAVNNFERKLSWERAVRAGFTLFISAKDVDNILEKVIINY